MRAGMLQAAMANRSHISVVEGETHDTAATRPASHGPEHEVALPPEQDGFEIEEQYEEDIGSPDRNWIVPTLAALVMAGWTAFFVWANLSAMLAGGSAADWARWIVDWSVPILLVVALWILQSRTSTREARRYGEVARTLSDETALLENRLVTVNRELSLAREFLGNQSRDLEYLGRSAAEKISEHADRLQGLIRDNGEQVDAIAGTSLAARENMESLRANLPVIANSAKDVSNQIGGVGRAAQDQLGAIIAGFERLNVFGEASERQVGSLRKRVDDAIAAFTAQAEEMEAVTARRFIALAEKSDEIRDDLQTHEIEALAAFRARSIALRSELADANTAANAEEDRVVEHMRTRMEALREDVAGLARDIRHGEDVAVGALDKQIDALRTRLEETVAEIEQVDAAALEAANAKLRHLFDEASAVDARITERNRLFEEEAVLRTERLGAAQDEIAHALETRMAALDDALEERREGQRRQLTALVEDGDALGERIAALGRTFGMVAAQGHEAREALAGGIDALGEQLRNNREALEGTDHEIARLTDASVRLLELIQASAKQSGETLPNAMKASEERLLEIERRANDIHGLLSEANATGERLSAGMNGIEDRTRAAMTGFDAFQQDFEGTSQRQIDGIERLRDALVALTRDTEQFAERIEGDLGETIADLETKARAALAAIEDEQDGRIQHLADTIGSRSAEQIERTLIERTDDALAELDAARSRSNDAARDMTKHLREQLGRINELTVNLESRIAHARDQATDTIDGDFARRVALITESLNSNSIDIARALSSEVTDTAWASYLRGDRGIFTRRAVRLLDNAEVKEIAQLYDTDGDFHEHVSRYIHDFETMLRTLLSTRDGNAVSVTLLSSDMGKLYVVLAQALERLRR